MRHAATVGGRGGAHSTDQTSVPSLKPLVESSACSSFLGMSACFMFSQNFQIWYEITLNISRYDQISLIGEEYTANFFARY